jgi:hypothetical protein
MMTKDEKKRVKAIEANAANATKEDKQFVLDVFAREKANFDGELVKQVLKAARLRGFVPNLSNLK